MFKKGDIAEIEITALSSEGKGIAKTSDGFVVFCEKTLPGDKVLARLKKVKKSYAEAKPVEILSLSTLRIDAPCPHFGVCGGCKIQNLEYNAQLLFKRQVVQDAFSKIGGFKEAAIPVPMPSPNIFYYRNKMEFSFSDDKWLDDPENEYDDEFALGLHVPGFHSKIIDVHSCFLQSQITNKIVEITRNFFKERGISIYSTSTHSGFLRFLIIRQSSNTEDLMVNLITYNYDADLMNSYRKHVLSEVPSITSLVNSTSQKKAQVAIGEKEYLLFGSFVIEEKLTKADRSALRYEISPNSFFQTNTLQAEKLFQAAAKFGSFNKEDRVLDLYCGAGSISLFISEDVKTVTGVELVEDAIINANRNAQLNGILNANFVCSDIKDFLSSSSISEFNKLVLDPPRSGLHPDICEALSHTAFEKIIYISCNPATQARDLLLINSKGKYKLEKMQPFDMFPHTYHVENIVSLIPA